MPGSPHSEAERHWWKLAIAKGMRPGTTDFRRFMAKHLRPREVTRSKRKMGMPKGYQHEVGRHR